MLSHTKLTWFLFPRIVQTFIYRDHPRGWYSKWYVPVIKLLCLSQKPILFTGFAASWGSSCADLHLLCNLALWYALPLGGAEGETGRMEEELLVCFLSFCCSKHHPSSTLSWQRQVLSIAAAESALFFPQHLQIQPHCIGDASINWLAPLLRRLDSRPTGALPLSSESSTWHAVPPSSKA